MVPWGLVEVQIVVVWVVCVRGETADRGLRGQSGLAYCYGL